MLVLMMPKKVPNALLQNRIGSRYLYVRRDGDRRGSFRFTALYAQIYHHAKIAKTLQAVLHQLSTATLPLGFFAVSTWYSFFLSARMLMHRAV